MDTIGRTAFINLEKIPCLALHCGGSAADATPMDEATPYACPTCGAEYKVVRVEAKTMVPEERLTCTKCGGPLNAREGRLCWPGAVPIKPPRFAYRSRGGSTNLPGIYSCFIARFGGVSDGKETHG